MEREPIEGSSVGFADIGSGEPAVLFIHGLGAQWRVWLPTIPAIAASRRVIAPDLPGFGISTPADGPVSVEGFADVLDQLCDRLGLGPVVVVGSSLGGLIATELTLRHPRRVERLVLVGAAGIVPTRGEHAKTVAFIWGGLVMGRSLQGARRQIASRPWLRKAVLSRLAHDASRIPPDLVYEGVLEAPGLGTRHALDAGLAHLTPEREDRLAQIDCPVLVIWGEKDALLPMRHARELTRLIPGARLVAFPETGHIPMVEQPKRFNRTLLEFIGADPEGAPGR